MHSMYHTFKPAHQLFRRPLVPPSPPKCRRLSTHSRLMIRSVLVLNSAFFMWSYRILTSCASPRHALSLLFGMLGWRGNQYEFCWYPSECTTNPGVNNFELKQNFFVFIKISGPRKRLECPWRMRRRRGLHLKDRLCCIIYWTLWPKNV